MVAIRASSAPSAVVFCFAISFSTSVHAGVPSAVVNAMMALATAYPGFITLHQQDGLRWRDGTVLLLGNSRQFNRAPSILTDATIIEQFYYFYPLDPWDRKLLPEDDPGRFRNKQFFEKMYGDCRKRRDRQAMRTVIWLPKTAPQNLQVTTVNGIDVAVEKLSAELEQLPPPIRNFATQLSGGFACRNISGTSLRSMHAYGAAIDLKPSVGRYWKWSGLSAAARKSNIVPAQIVDLFEKYGFIWGGKWYHVDSLHFEYRPELIEYSKRVNAVPENYPEEHPL
jgi:hypothetical protein